MGEKGWASEKEHEEARDIARKATGEMSSKEIKKVRGVFERPLGSGVWWIQYFDAAGKRHREKVGTRDSAKKLVELRRTHRLEGRKLPKLRSRPLTFSELASAVSEDKSNYRMPMLTAKFGNMPAEEIAPAEIKAWLEEHDEWSLATKNRYIALLKLTDRLAEEAQRIKQTIRSTSPVRQSKENNARIRWLTDEEEITLRAAMPSEHLAQFEIALNTGMRKSEAITKGALGERRFHEQLAQYLTAKNGEVRYVRLNSRVQAVFAMLKPTPAAGRIMTLKAPRGWFEQAVEDSGVAHFTWHDLRHTFISRLVMAGVDLRTVMELAGHKTIQMTMRYAHLAPSHVAQAVEKLGPECHSKCHLYCHQRSNQAGGKSGRSAVSCLQC